MTNNILVVQKRFSPSAMFVNELGKKFCLTVVNTKESVMEYTSNPELIAGTDCIIIDFSIEFSTAVELLRTLKTLNISKHMSFVALSICMDGSVQEKLIEEGITEFIDIRSSLQLACLKLSHIVDYRRRIRAFHELEKDELTGLYSRQAFLRRAVDFINDNPDKDFFMVAIDFENFKYTNNHYGENKCNEFLGYTGEKLKSFVQNGLSCRWGGDQFISLCSNTSNIDIDYIRTYVENGLKNAPIPHQKAKIGIYCPIDKTQSITICCDRAFLAIRKIKGVYNKDIVFYEDSMQKQLNDEQKITSLMERAILEEQFLVYYQPKHETVGGKIAGAEALIRWIHPEEGFMNPGQFIPLFERNGFITKIDAYVVKKVCDDMLRWKKAGLPLVPVSINISRRDYLEKDWMQSQVDYIDSLKIDHKLIHFEVTESLYAEYMDLIIEQVRNVQLQKFKIEMDDFGSGYSTLGLLATFPLDVIKLDISFVRHIDTNEIVIENIINMAHKMGLSVIAEGCETQEQFSTLKSLGCDLIQGFVFSKPLCCKDFEEYLKNSEVENADAASLKKMASETGKEILNENLLKAASDLGDQFPGGFFSYHADNNHEVISFNRELLKIFECETGAEFREYIRNSFEGMMSPDEYRLVSEEIREQISDENDICHIKYSITTKKGNVKFLDQFGRAAITNKYGKIFYVFVNDITESHIQHQSVTNRSEVIEGLSRSYSCIYLIEFDTKKMIPFSILEDYRSIIMGMLDKGYNYDEVVYAFADGYVQESEREKIKQISVIDYIKKQFEKDDIYAFTFHLVKDGHTSLTELSFRKVYDENKNTRAVLTFRGVSEQMINADFEKNEELLQELQEQRVREIQAQLKMEQALQTAELSNKSSGVIMSRYAEDVNTLLDEINAISEEAIKAENIESAREYLKKINVTEEKVLRMMKNITITGQIIAGNCPEVHNEPVVISDAVERTLAGIKNLADAKNITVETFSNIECPYIYQDLDKTANMTLSVLSNAIKYTPEGGHITFGLTQYPGVSPDECIIEFVCRDNGIGISEEFVPKMFQPFAREENSINNEIPGSGVGLYIVKSLVDVQNGKIDLFTKQGIGIEIKISIAHKYATVETAKKIEY